MATKTKNKIASFEDACKALKISPALPDFSAMPEKHQKALTAHYKLVIIAEALNNGWQPNWNNRNEWKYYPWFGIKASEEKPSGFGFSHYDYVRSATTTVVGSHLCFKTEALAMYAGEQFSDLYQDYFLM